MKSSAKRVWYAFVISLLAAIIPAGCSGGSGTSALPSQSQSKNPLVPQSLVNQAASGNVTFAIGITPKKASAGLRRSQYVSPSTESMQILTDDGNAVVVDLSPSSPNCSPNPTVPGSYICTASLTVPAGNHVFTVTAYDLPGGKGNVLSTNSTGTVYVKPTGKTTVSIVLLGVVKYVTLTLSTSDPPVGKAATIVLTPVPEDADHNVIVGPGAFEHPLTLTTTDPVNGPLSKTTLNSPADESGITVNYNGASVASITYSATASGLPAANVTDASLTPIEHNAWKLLSPMPTARTGSCAGVIGTKVYVVGGYGSAGLLGVNEVYDTVTNSWSSAAPMPTPRWYFACAVVGDIFYAIGGERGVGGGPQTTVVEAYNATVDKWTTGLKPMPTIRNSISAAVYDGNIWVVGGYNSISGRLANAEAYSPSTDSWSIEPNLKVAKSGVGVGAVGGSIIVADGLSDVATTDNEGYTAPSSSWTALRSSPTPRFNVCSGTIGESLYIAAGSNGTSLSLLEIYNLAANTWTAAAPTNTPVTVAPGAAVGGRLLCFGGSNSDLTGGTYYNLVQAYQP